MIHVIHASVQGNTNTITPPPHTPRPMCIEQYVKLLQRKTFAGPLLLFYLLLFITGVLYGPGFLSETKLKMVPPPNSYSATASEALRSNFPMLVNQSTGIILITATATELPVNVVNNTATQTFETELLTTLFNTTKLLANPCFVNFDSYFLRAKAGEIAQAQRFTATHDGRDAMMELFTLTNDCGQSKLQTLAKQIMDVTKKVSAKHLAPAGMVARVTGMDAFLVDVLAGIEHDIALMDAVAFPIALVILMSVLQSGRLLILPILCMVLTILSSFLIMVPVAAHMDVVTFAPSVQMSLSIALSIDYSLFLLGRYREELQLNHKEHDQSVVQMLRHAGHVVFVSNTTLTLCFLGNLFFSSILLATIGIAAAATCVCALVINVTLVPTLLLLFSSFFQKSIEPGLCCCGGGSGPTLPNVRSNRVQLERDSRYNILSDTHDEGNDHPKTGSCWNACAFKVVHFHKTVICAVLCLTAPFAWRVSQGFRHSTSLLQLVPRGVASTEAFSDLGTFFGVGISDPYRIIVVAPLHHAIIGGAATHYTLDPVFCNVTRNVLKNYVAKPRTIHGVAVTSEIASLAYISRSSSEQAQAQAKPDVNLCAPMAGGIKATIPEVCAELGWSKEIKMDGASCADVKSLYDRYNVTSAHPSRPATLVDVAINIDPDSPTAGVYYEELVDDLNRAQQEVQGIDGYTFVVTSLAASQHDTNQHAFAIFPMAVGITGAVVFLLIGVAFRSMVVPLRAVFSIGLTLCLVYGAAIFVFEDGMLAFLQFKGLMPLQNDASLCWIPPILSFSIVVGLGLDYDVFLLSRILEAREDVHVLSDDRQAIVIGLTKTGSTITAAGCIMATAFSGLLFSSEPVLNQISFFLVFAVLVDTFVIRALFVPALMTALRGKNWWPRKMAGTE